MFIDNVVPRYLDRLLKRLRGRERSSAVSSREKYLSDVETCLSCIQLCPAPELEASCMVMFNINHQIFYSCLGDLSRTSNENEHDICMHVEAAMRKYPIPPEHVLKIAEAVRKERGRFVSRIRYTGLARTANDDTAGLEDESPDFDDSVYQCHPVSIYHLGQRGRRRYYVNMQLLLLLIFFGPCPHVIALDAVDEEDEPVHEKLKRGPQIRNESHINMAWVAALNTAFPEPSHGSSCDMFQCRGPQLLT
jgi:hypothetical protein